MKQGDVIQVRKENGRIYISYPENAIKRLIWRGELPPMTDGSEWECRVISDTRPSMHQIGELTIQLVREVSGAWSYESRSPRIYDCQRVQPVFTAGKRRPRAGSPPPDMVAEAERRCRAFDQVKARALAELAPLAAAQDQRKYGPQSVSVNLPGLTGRLCTHGEDTEYARAFYVDDDGRLIKRWQFRTEPDSYYDDDAHIKFDVVVAHGFRRGFFSFHVADWELVVRDLGDPVQVTPSPYSTQDAWQGLWKFGGHVLNIPLLEEALEAARASSFGSSIREQEQVRAVAKSSVRVKEDADRQRELARARARQAAVAAQNQRHGRRR